MHAVAWRFLSLLIACVALAVAPAAAQTPGATDLRVGIHPDHTRLVIDLTGKVTYNIFALSDPYRMVVDLPEIEWRMAETQHRGGVIEALRYGLLQPGTSRIVMDLNRPAKVGNSFLMPPSEGKDYRLVIDLVPIDHASFMAGLGAPPLPPPPPQAALTPRVPPPAAVLPPGMPGRKPDRSRRRVVVIDPGHGGVDPGAISLSGAMEKDITLAAARDFKRRLAATGRYEVHLTRDTDVFIRLRDRIAIARAKGADLFISVHADALSNHRVRGMSVYTLSEKASDKEAADLAEKENKADLIAGIDLSSESANVTNILIDLAQRETMNESARFAGHLVDELREVSKVLPRTHRFAGFAVLKAPDVPSVLLEMGFLSNRLDERALTDPKYRARMADSLVQAVGRFFQQVEKAERK